ncbi:YccJ family protein [Pseudoalteromonas sp. M8]|uniref:YccJ family protein n=1 Tax=Pseudoalteromonas sp. M8 TaxID=2692624 RepID=UPI001BA8C0AF|nr:YccJ family protein [Pseudoalteromonas sp. M8]QUI71280.1 hypothetical protein GSF13_16660 [Pseudoalteromonas sp. M8]
MNNVNLQNWADSRETSLEIAEAIFELANNNETLAQEMWEEGDDRVQVLAFSKTDEDELFWGNTTLTR